ncbi:MAG: hypothetical protein IPG10_06825 [Flavobacteriales bacterium]|nr:hypothetical protein [Flavobacteriales bacterium]MBK6752593.1 hypothetical protein [Flavobacteriales bacterium]MBK7085355.1 hypothetical protein [Flavobacteriales bacterium]MBK7268523.1 hypothetical protein [Flavobacteriales bacterium]MBK7753037.1 hypothetical protein [Flavobacteriales bacterium]
MSSRKKTLILSQPPLKEGTKHIKVRLDARTTVLLKSMKAFAFWKERYPQAAVIE